MATTRKPASSTSDPNGDDFTEKFVARVEEYRNELRAKVKEVEELKKAHAEAGKLLRNAEKEKNTIMENITRYVMSSQQELI